ncbi:MAG: radical SAM protein [Candidatus Bathyarchaeia archaeon]
MPSIFKPRHTGKCKICGLESPLISSYLGVCVKCIREDPEESLKVVLDPHRKAREQYRLPPQPCKIQSGIKCNICSNECAMSDGDVSFCGLRWVENGQLKSHVDNDKALLYYYLDPHVTNCCSAWFCPAGTGVGYPQYAYTKGPEYNYYDLAIFFYGCNFDCLFCQNYSHKRFEEARVVTVKELIHATLSNTRISCWCFFGGSPEPQLPFAINASKRILEHLHTGRILRICFEWNGCGNKALVDEAGELSLKTGGNIKFDLKAFSNSLSIALSGVSNRRAFENFEALYNRFYMDRPNLPVLTATTLLVPGYVDSEEVEGITKFLADLNPEIPYSLLVFHPNYLMRDLPVTPMEQVVKCYRVAKSHLKNVHIGNLYLIGFYSMGDFENIYGGSY